MRRNGQDQTHRHLHPSRCCRHRPVMSSHTSYRLLFLGFLGPQKLFMYIRITRFQGCPFELHLDLVAEPSRRRPSPSPSHGQQR